MNLHNELPYNLSVNTREYFRNPDLQEVLDQNLVEHDSDYAFECKCTEFLSSLQAEISYEDQRTN